MTGRTAGNESAQRLSISIYDPGPALHVGCSFGRHQYTKRSSMLVASIYGTVGILILGYEFYRAHHLTRCVNSHFELDELNNRNKYWRFLLRPKIVIYFLLFWPDHVMEELWVRCWITRQGRHYAENYTDD